MSASDVELNVEYVERQQLFTERGERKPIIIKSVRDYGCSERPPSARQSAESFLISPVRVIPPSSSSTLFSGQASLRLVIVIAILAAYTLPITIIWILESQTNNDSVNLMNVCSGAIKSMAMSCHNSIAVASASLQMSITRAGSQLLYQDLSDAENFISFSTHKMKTEGVLDIPYGVSSNFWSVANYLTHGFFFMVANPKYSFWTATIYNHTSSSDVYVEWFAYTRLNLNVVTGQFIPVVYLTFSTMKSDHSLVEYWFIDQVTGVKLFLLYSVVEVLGGYSPNGVLVNITRLANDNITQPHWIPDLSFSEYSGIPYISVYQLISFNSNNNSAIRIELYFDVYAASGMLRELLFSQNDRAFITFPTPAGTLISASHGKVFSHSDKDYSKNNPLVTPPPFKDFRKYTPLNSTDPIILNVAIWLWDKFGAWDNIPEDYFAISNAQNVSLMWISTQFIKSKAGLLTQIFVVVDADARIGLVKQNNISLLFNISRASVQTLEGISATNTQITIILCSVLVVVLIFALFIVITITKPIENLSNSMHAIAMLDIDISDATCAKMSTFSFVEIVNCEKSFAAMKRGLKALSKYIPIEIVKLMLDGRLECTHLMHRRNVTILIMNIVDFESVCESLDPASLETLATEYLESMCEIIVNNQGTLDKFVGDSIMALWNAPLSVTDHAVHAILASFSMQEKLLILCQDWLQIELPSVRFHVGINTGDVLVGNFGCNLKVCFTCLGTEVNTAVKLESVNKKFGSTVLVSEATMTAARMWIFFRQIANVTLIGKSEILAVYEPLFQIELFEGKSSDPIGEDCIFHWNRANTQQVKELAVLYEKGLHAYIAGDFEEANHFLTRCNNFFTSS